MVDVKQVAIAVDTSQIVRAETALKAAEQAGRRTSASVNQLETAYQRASGSLAGMNRANQANAASTRAAQQGAAQLGRSVDSLDRSYDQAAASAGAFQRATASASSGLGLASRHAKSYEAQAANASRHTANLGAQFNDIGVQLAAGTSPLLLAVQQGTQINQVMDQLGRGTGRVRTLVAAFTSIISPMSLATIGIIAGGAALAQWGLKAAAAKIETRSLAELTDDLADSVQTYQDAADSVLMSIDDQADAYGSLADEMREVNRIQAELAQGAAQQTLDRLTASIGTASQGGMLQRALAANPMTDVMSAFTGRDAIQRFFEIPAETTSRVEALLGGFRQMNEQLQAAKGNTDEQGRLLRAMLPIAKSLAEEYGKGDTAQQRISKSQRAFLDSLVQAADQSARIVALNEVVITGTAQRAQLSERDAHWAQQTLARMEAQAVASQTIAAHGANSAAVMDQQLGAQQEALATELKRRGITGELARSLQEALVAQQNANVAAEERQRYDREAQRLAQEREQAAQRELQLAVQREHAEANIAQRLQNRIEVARAIVVHGKDSVQAKLAEEAVSQRLFELDLDRHGITGDIRQQLIGQYQAAAQLESQIVQAQPAFQGLQQTIAGISNAWGEFVVSGFRDFKDFTKNVFEQFKRLLVQMVATAAKNRIMFSMGMGGIGGAPMGMLGGGGGGSPLSFLGKMFGGGGGSGGGMFSGPFGGGLKNAAFNMGLIHGPAIAGGGAAALASGAATSAAFGFGPAAGIGAGGLTAGGGAMAATGLTGLGTALAVAAPIAVLGLALMKSSKTIDRGTKIIVDGLTATAEGYRTVQESRFFGLSKRERDRGETLESGIQSEWDAFLERHMRQLELSSRLFGLNTDKLSEFSSTITISGSESDKGAAKIAELTRGMEGMLVAGTALEGKLADMGVGLWDLAGTFVQVDAILKDLRGQRIARGPAGAMGAHDLASQFGGIEQFQSAAVAFYEGFFSAGERMDHLRAQVTETLQGIATETPGVMGDAVSVYSTALNTMRGLTGDVSEAMSTVYRELVQAQDLNTESGRTLYAELLQLAPAMRTLIDHESELAQARMEAAEAAQEAAAAEAKRAAEAKAAASAMSSRVRATRGADSNNPFYDRSRVGQVTNPYEAWWLVGPGSGSRTALGGGSRYNQGGGGFPGTNELFGRNLGESVANFAWRQQTGRSSQARGRDIATQFMSSLNSAGLAATLNRFADPRQRPLPELRDATSFTREFYGELEQSASIVPSLREAFDRLNLGMPKTRAEFRELVEAQDLTTHAGRNAYNSLIELSGSFASMAGEAMELNDALGLTRDVFRDVREEAFARSAQAQGGAARMIELSPDAIRQIAAAVSTGDVGAARIVSAIDRFADRNARDFEDYIEIAERDFYEPTTETVDLS